MSKQTLFNITADHLELMSDIMDAEGILTPELEQRLIINEKNRDVKSVAYLEVIRKNEAWNIMVDEEIKRLTASKKRSVTLISHLKERLVGAVNLFGDFKVGTLEFGTRKSTVCVIDDAGKIPMKFQIKKVTTAPDKKAIKTAIDSGKEVAGAHLQINKSLKIK